MSILRGRWVRPLAVLLLMAASLLVTLTTGGCGGGGGGNDGSTTDGPTLAITVDNGEDVATAVVTGVLGMFEITEATGGPLLEPAAAANPVLQKAGRLAGTYYQVPVEGTEPCAVTGTVTLSGNLADPNTITEGDTIGAVFDNCDDGDGFVIDGGLQFTIIAIDGDPFTDVYRLTLGMVLSSLNVTADGETVSADGDLTYTLDSLGFPTATVILSGSELTVGAAGEQIGFRNFDQTLTVNAGMVPTTYAAEADGRLRSSTLGGSVDYRTITTIRARGDDNPPFAGEVLVDGADASEVRIVIVSEESVRLEIDVNGDGVVDAFVDTTWAALASETSG